MLAEVLTAFYILNIAFLLFINVVFKKENSAEIEGGKPGSIWTPCSIAVIKEGQNMGREYTACPDETHFSVSWEAAREPAGMLEIILKSLYMV